MKNKLHTIEDGLFKNTVAVDVDGQLFLSQGKNYIKIYGDLKKVVARYYKLELFI